MGTEDVHAAAASSTATASCATSTSDPDRRSSASRAAKGSQRIFAISFGPECSRYRLKKLCGQGTYGVVASGQDRLTGGNIAVKKLRSGMVDEKSCRSTLRELRMLSHFDHQNILSLRDLKMSSEADVLYLVTDLMDSDLHCAIQSETLAESHIQYFIYQLLQGVNAMHASGVVHRDLKPSNLLINKTCELVICDFGMARALGNDLDPEDNLLSAYVCTRWYRAPELLLQNQRYGTAVDMWSVGCVLAELLGGRAIFRGANPLEQLKLITGTVGRPAPEDLAWVENDRARQHLSTLRQRPWTPLDTLYPKASPQALDLLGRLLVFDPAGRLSAMEALGHPYLRDVSEYMGGRPELKDQRPQLDLNVEAHSQEELRWLIRQEVAMFATEADMELCIQASAHTSAPTPVMQPPARAAGG